MMAITLATLKLTPAAFAQPVNDNFTNAIQIIGTNATVAGSNIGATMEPGEPDDYGYDGKSVWWYWQAPAKGYLTISTDGSLSTIYPGYSLYADLEIYTGNSVPDLTLVASGGDDASNGLSVSFATVAGTIYRIAVDGVNFEGDAYDYPAYTDEGTISLSLNYSPGLPSASPWALPDISGKELYSTNFAGDVVVLNFWATWCGPCCDELPALIALQQMYAPDGLTVIGLSVDDATNNAPPFDLVSQTVAQYGINYPVAMTRPLGYSVENAYGGIPYIPNTFIIDRQNLIEQVFVGEQDYSTYEQAILPLLYANLTVNVSVANGMIHLSWPVTQASFVVQSSGDLSSGAWSTDSTTTQSDGVNNFIDIAVGASNRFYRLHLQ